MSEKFIAHLLYQYIVLNYSQSYIANDLGISPQKVSGIIRDFNFNQVNTGAYQSGYDRGRYKNYKGIQVTEQMIYNFIRNNNYNNFENYLNDIYKNMVERRRQENANRKKESEYRIKRAEQAQQQQLKQEEYRRQEANRRRIEEQQRLKREAEHNRKEKEQRRQEEIKNQRRQDQIDKKVHISWMKASLKYCEEKNYTEALKYAEASYDLKPMLGNIYAIAYAAHMLGQYELAYKMSETLVEEEGYMLTNSTLIRAESYVELFKEAYSNISVLNFIKDFKYLRDKGLNLDKLLFTFAESAIEYGDDKEKQLAIEIYKECIEKRIEVKSSHVFLANYYYENEMWQEAIDSINILESSYPIGEGRYNINYNADLNWRKGVSYYKLGDFDSAFICFDSGLPMDYRKDYPYSRECLPASDEEQIFMKYLDDLRNTGNYDKLKHHKEDLKDRKLLLNGKITAQQFYGESFDGQNYRFVYNENYDEWEKQYIEEQGIGSTLLNFVGNLINR